MSIAMVVLSVVAVLIFFGVVQRVLDRMYLTDRTALLLVAAMFAGTFLPNVEAGRVSIGIGGAVIPMGVCIYLLIRADSGRERMRALLSAALTGVAVYALAAFLPDEPEQMRIEPNLLYGLCGGAIAWLLSKSRRGAFFSGVTGVIAADVATALINWKNGIDQQLVLGGAGIADAVVVSGVLAVLLAELVGEVTERISRRRRNAA